MCGRIVYVWDPVTKQLVEKLVDDADFDAHTQHVLEKQRYNVPPSSHLPVLAQRDGRTIVEVARWGFPIPQRPNGVFNTRIETVHESPMWRSLIGHGNCLFFARGFYEWRRDAKRKVPHFVQRADAQPMLLGGIAGSRTVNGEAKLCASIITCAPSEAMESLHDRMPVVIEENRARDWLQGDATLDLAVPARDDVLVVHQVGPAVGDTKNDDASLMEPVENTGLGAFA